MTDCRPPPRPQVDVFSCCHKHCPPAYLTAWKNARSNVSAVAVAAVTGEHSIPVQQQERAHGNKAEPAPVSDEPEQQQARNRTAKVRPEVTAIVLGTTSASAARPLRKATRAVAAVDGGGPVVRSGSGESPVLGTSSPRRAGGDRLPPEPASPPPGILRVHK